MSRLFQSSLYSRCAFGQSPESTHSGGSQCVGYLLGEHMALQFSTLNSAFLEAVHEFSARRTRAPSVGDDFRSHFCLPETCV
jgi:hypothetical protein